MSQALPKINEETSLSEILSLLRQSKETEALQRLTAFLCEHFRFKIKDISFHQDNYSLNSVRGFIALEPGSAPHEKLFFKFHQEEKEKETISEYYRADILAKAGFPIDQPLYENGVPGAQILIYRRRDWPRFSDLCRETEQDGCPPAKTNPLLAAEEELNKQAGAIYLKSLHKADAGLYAKESVLQLFTWRLFEDGDVTKPGGRIARFYEPNNFAFNTLDRPLSFKELCALKWRINGTNYDRTLGDAIADARRLMAPEELAKDGAPAMICHGDAHNANIWFDPNAETGKTLLYFDPAFAGEHVPALIGEIKPLFHNIFAHPDWLYFPEDATKKLDIKAHVEGDTLVVEHNWNLNPLRMGLLRQKRDSIFAPLLKACAEKNMLRKDWRAVMKAALFCCPSLVMNLTPGIANHDGKTGLLGFCVAMMMGAEPSGGKTDACSEFFDDLEMQLAKGK